METKRSNMVSEVTQMANVQRINIRVSDELNNGIQELANRYGMTKSSVCAFILGKQVYTELKALDLVLNNENITKMLEKFGMSDIQVEDLKK